MDPIGLTSLTGSGLTIPIGPIGPISPISPNSTTGPTCPINQPRANPCLSDEFKMLLPLCQGFCKVDID